MKVKNKTNLLESHRREKIRDTIGQSEWYNVGEGGFKCQESHLATTSTILLEQRASMQTPCIYDRFFMHRFSRISPMRTHHRTMTKSAVDIAGNVRAKRCIADRRAVGYVRLHTVFMNQNHIILES